MRRKRFSLNIITALLKQIVCLVCGFVLPRYILQYYGSDVNGLLTSITQFLGFITFLEMGIGPVIQSNLYKPLAEKNQDEISKIVVSSERFFRRIAMIFLVYIVVLFFVFPTKISTGFNFWYTASLILIIAISIFAQYYFGLTYLLLLNADQKSYVQFTLQLVTILLNTIVSIILMKLGASIQIVKLASSSIFFLRTIGQMLYVHRHYDINRKVKFKGEPIKQKWNGFAQHLASVVVTNTDVVVLTLFSTMKNVSIYSVYYTVVYGVENTVMTMVTGLEALWGNMLAKKEHDKLLATFEIVEWVIHAGCSYLFAVTSILVVPFIQVYTRGIHDANYEVPLFGFLISMAYCMLCFRVPYFRIIKAAGHYKQTQNGSFIQMAINIVLSLLLVYNFGLNGVAAGTLVAMIYHTTYFAWYLRNHILNRKFSIYLKHVAVDVFSIVSMILLTRWIHLDGISYLKWGLMAVKVGVIGAVIAFVINFIFYRRFLVQIGNMVLSKLRGSRNQ